ncbi:MAG TPA: DMT family transporter [Caldimonas sp.]|jgi:S-adenosylmethionine uptake transporter|nr:DMT family transporter [Caldimonas sp.]HEX2539781.1 DMT family transporter [Caldimonas sp.]
MTISAPWLIVGATFLFSTMGVCVKLASAEYPAGEIVFYRSLTGAVLMLALARWQRGTVATRLPGMHFWRSVAGVTSLVLWFYALGNLPLATAMTLNYMSSVWMALFLIGGAVALGTSRVDGRLIVTVLIGFLGVALILRPTIEERQLWHGLMGLLSGVIAATAYLQVTALGRAGEPEYRIVFYFSVGGVGVGLLTMLWSGVTAHSWRGAVLLLAVGVTATLAQLMMTRAYSTGRTLVNASLQYLGIGWAFAFGVVLFDDPVTWMAICGMLLVVGAGIGATMLRSRSSGSAAGAGDSPNTL